jgi:polar amino acid transport system substrate-binding protein
MKHTYTITCLLTLLFFSVFIPLYAQETIVVVGNHAPPYRIIEDGEFSGIYFDTIKAIAERLKLSIEFREEPFARALVSMERGDADIMLGPNRTPEREKFLIYTDATFPPAQKAFYVHPDAPSITTYEDLSGKIIAVHRGKVYFDRFDHDTALQKEDVNSYEQAIMKVVKGRNDVVIMPEQEGDYLLQQLGVELKKSSYIVPGNVSYLTISKQSPIQHLQHAIEEAMAAIKADGAMQTILVQYGHQSPEKQ